MPPLRPTEGPAEPSPQLADHRLRPRNHSLSSPGTKGLQPPRLMAHGTARSCPRAVRGARRPLFPPVGSHGPDSSKRTPSPFCADSRTSLVDPSPSTANTVPPAEDSRSSPANPTLSPEAAGPAQRGAQRARTAPPGGSARRGQRADVSAAASLAPGGAGGAGRGGAVPGRGRKGGSRR